jgi:hypothetical protein
VKRWNLALGALVVGVLSVAVPSVLGSSCTPPHGEFPRPTGARARTTATGLAAQRRAAPLAPDAVDPQVQVQPRTSDLPRLHALGCVAADGTQLPRASCPPPQIHVELLVLHGRVSGFLRAANAVDPDAHTVAFALGVSCDPTPLRGSDALALLLPTLTEGESLLAWVASPSPLEDWLALHTAIRGGGSRAPLAVVVSPAPAMTAALADRSALPCALDLTEARERVLAGLWVGGTAQVTPR